MVELLVVIAITSVLIGVLLPAAILVRSSAQTVVCMSNMRQITAAVLSYTDDNRGHLMPALIYPLGSKNPYPDGFFWAAELVHQGYLRAPNLPHDPKNPNNAVAPIPDAGVFDCPSGLRPGDWDADKNGFDNGEYPTDPRNNGWCYMIDDNPRLDGQPAYGTATYYELNCRTNGYTAVYNSGVFNPPFMYFASGTDKLNQTEAQAIANQNYSRTLSMIRHSTEMVLLTEVSNINWITQVPTTVGSTTHYAPRLGARHGKRSADGSNAFTNFAFFDGHVATYPTDFIDRNPGTDNGAVIAGVSSGIAGMSAMTQSSGVVFTMYMDRQ